MKSRILAVARALGGLVLVGCSVDPAPLDEPPAPAAGSAGAPVAGAGGAASGASAGGNAPTAGNTAIAGSGGSTVPSGGTSGAGGSATAGATSGGAGGTSGGFTVPRGKSAGCNKPSNVDEPGKYTSHDIEVTGVDPYWLSERKPYAGQAPYTFTHRAFSIRLPTGYDPSRAYPVVFQGGGCGNTDGTSGKNGGDKLIPDNQVGEGISIGLSYVYPDGAGACFADDGANTYEIPYWDAVYKQVTENYCVDLEKVFIGGYSSGAWMAYTTAFARGGKVRGMGAGAGGIREKRPAPSAVPFAAMLITGEGDEANPVHKTKDKTTCAGTEAQGCWKGEIICGFPGAEDCYDTGSAHARDEILQRNGCVGNETKSYGQWADCKQYTGCPAAFPVVYCMPAGGHTGGDDRHTPGIWDFWKALPSVP